jgi:hypothetical protein
VPVIVQPLVEQAYHQLLPYHLFTLSYNLSDVPRLPQLLAAVPPERICELRAAAAKYYRALVWQTPDGCAYEMLQIALCRRAADVRKRLYPRRPTPSWAQRCKRLSADDVLMRGPIATE